MDCRAEVSLEELAPTAEGVVKVLLGPAERRGCGLGLGMGGWKAEGGGRGG